MAVTVPSWWSTWAPSGQTRYGARTKRTSSGAIAYRVSTSRLRTSSVASNPGSGTTIHRSPAPSRGVLRCLLELNRRKLRNKSVDQDHRKNVDGSGDDEHDQIASRRLLDPSRR